MAEGGSLRDYFIRFLFKTDKEGAKKTEDAIGKIGEKLDSAGHAAFEFNEKIEAVKKIYEPFKKFKELIEQTAEEADNLRDMSERTGIATQKLEELGFMAKLAGTSQETLATGLRILDKNMGEAAAGGKEQAEAFGKLGIALHGANGKLKTVDELLPEVSAAFEKLPDHASKTAMAMKLFGRSGQELLPLLERGPEELEHMRKELALLGGVTSEDFLDASEKYVDNIERMNQIWKGIRQAIAGPFIRMFNQANDALIKWFKVNGDIARAKIGEWAQQLVTSFQALKATVIDLAAPFLIFAAALNAPLLIMVGLRALLALIIDDFANWRQGNDSVIGRVIDNWDEWMSKVEKSHPILAGFLEMAKAGLKNVYAILLMIENLTKSLAEGQFLKELKTILHTAAKFYGMTGDSHEGGTVVSDPEVEKILAAKGGAGWASRDDQLRQRTIMGTGIIPGAAGGGSPTVNAPTTINVQASPGMDTRDLANKVGEIVDQRIDTAVRQSYQQVIPEAY